MNQSPINFSEDKLKYYWIGVGEYNMKYFKNHVKWQVVISFFPA